MVRDTMGLYCLCCANNTVAYLYFNMLSFMLHLSFFYDIYFVLMAQLHLTLNDFSYDSLLYS